MIRLIQTISAGNALRLFLTPDIAVQWRILRRTDDNFTGVDDEDAVRVYEHTRTTALSEFTWVDTHQLVNGTRYYYRIYAFDGIDWIADTPMSGVPDSTYRGGDNDVLSFVRERLQLGLVQEITRKRLFPNSGKIAVLNAPPQFENAAFPVVTIHIDKDAPAERFMGESLYEDTLNDSNESWIETEGWLAQWSLSIIGWSMNPDERIALRNAIKRVLLINLPVFDAWGMDQVSFDFSDSEDLNSYPAPIYQVITNFSCIAPAYVSASAGSRVSDVQLTVR